MYVRQLTQFGGAVNIVNVSTSTSGAVNIVNVST